jgi:uracil-DNA glycosylase
MRISDGLGCTDFPCTDVNHAGYRLPDLEVDPETISILLISEASPANPDHDYYADGAPQPGSLFEQTTVLAFQDAGAPVASLRDLLDLGVYCTNGIKCAKAGYTVKAATVNTCSFILEQELARFPNVRAYLLMGDVAIKAINAIARRAGEPRPIPAGSTYKIRGAEYRLGAHFQEARVFPSYLQAGPSFFIEKSKRVMIAEDIAAALSLRP